MSGGVDSSVAALLLSREGAEVIGLSMHLHPAGEGERDGRCCTLDDLALARRAAERIGIPHFVVDLEERFADEVVRPFAQAYLSGETPVPCLPCNTSVKFPALLERAAGLGCELVATGHYARTETDPSTGEVCLLRGTDPEKDQSYFLYELTSEQLRRVRFPVGGMTKGEVRELAREAGLPNWDKPDSQELCFVPAGERPAGFIRERSATLGLSLPALAGAEPGEIVDRNGTLLGRHEGLLGFTVGQRRGIGVAASEPLYVLELDAASRRVVVGGASELESRVVELRSLVLSAPAPAAGPLPVLARIRYRHPEQPALLVPEGAELRRGATARLEFSLPVRAAAPGQAAVFFDPARPERVLGGGVIRKRSSSTPVPL